MKKIIFLQFVLMAGISISSLNAANITSTVAGGSWNVGTTWMGGVVPTINDYVYLIGPVSLNINASCASLTVYTNGILQNSGTGHTLTIYGNLVNEGILIDQHNQLNLTVYGNIELRGTTNMYKIEMAGAGNQTIYLLPGKIIDVNFFNSTAGNVTAISDLVFFDTEVDFNLHQLILQPGYSLDFQGNGTLRNLREIVIIGNNNSLTTSSGYCGQTFTGNNLQVNGVFRVAASDVIFSGNSILNGIIENSGGNHEVQFTGTLTNNGTIQNGSNLLTVTLYGDVSNYGNWTAWTSNFAGAVPQEIWFAAGTSFAGSYFTYTGSSFLNLNSDIRFVNTTVTLNFSTLNCAPGIFIHHTGNLNVLRNGVIVGNNSTLLLRGVYIQGITASDLTLRGMFQIGDNNSSFTNTFLPDTLLNYGSGHFVTFHGDFTNTGVVTNGTNLLSVYCTGDVYNYGIWNCYATYLSGSNVQHLTFSHSNVFAGQIFQYTGSASTIHADSDLRFDGTAINFSNKTLQMPDNSSFEIMGTNRACINFTLSGNNIRLKSVGTSYFQNIVVNADVSAHGELRIGDNNVVINGNLTVVDTIGNYGSGHTLTINGNLINNGVVTNLMNTLNVNISGDLINSGIFSNNEINIQGSVDEHIRLMAGKNINKPVKFHSNLGGNGWVWYKNGTPVPGATSPVYTLNTITEANYGLYYCISSEGKSRNFTIHENIAAGFTSNAPASGSAPLLIDFTNQTTGGFSPLTYSWDFGDGSVSSEINPSHTYLNPGFYNVILSASDDYHTNSITRINHVFVCTQPQPDFYAESVCFGELVYFEDASMNLNYADDTLIRYATSVINFSSQWSPDDWAATKILGEPDVYPAHYDSINAWAPLTPNGPREWIEIGFDNPLPVSEILIYETLRPGTVDTVYIKNPETGLWEMVWQGTATPAPLEARILTVAFPTTSFPVSQVRIAMNTAAVAYWNEIDAVGLVTNYGSIPSQETVYEWDLDGDGINDYTGKGSFWHEYTTPGIYNVRLKITNNDECTQEISHEVGVNTEPAFELHPASQTICDGAGAIFSAYAVTTGDYGLNYLWVGPTGFMFGETQPQLVIDPVSVEDEGEYYLIAYNDCGTEYSETAYLTIQQNPIAYAGIEATICENETFSAQLATAQFYESLLWESTGTGTFDDPSKINTVYTPSPADAEAGLITLNLTAFAVNPCFINSSSSLGLTLWLLPKIISQPAGTALCEGLPYSLEINATGTNPLHFQWYGPRGLILDAVQNTFNFTALTPDDEGEYYCIVSNNCDEVYSWPAFIQVYELPEFDVQPANLNTLTGEDAVFSVQVSGEEPLSLQWYGPEGLLENETGTDLIIPKVNFLSGGNFYCIAENFCSAVPSTTASLEVLSGGVSQTVLVPGGWSGISTCLWMDNPTVSDFMEPYLSNLIILHNDERIFWPDGGINTIGLWNNQHAYKIKVTAATQLVFEGSAENEKTLHLDAGWNLIPVISQCPVVVEDIFSGVSGQLVLVKDVAGTGVYWPGFAINNLINLLPGKAYFVLMENDAEITFSDCSALKNEPVKVRDDKRAATGNCPWLLPFVTPNTHTVVITVAAAVKLNLHDWIGAFDKSGKCLGSCQWQGKPAVMTLFGDDSYTPAKDGFDENEPFIFKSFNAVTGAEFVVEAGLDLNFQQNSFITNGLSVITSLKTGVAGSPATGQGQVFIYPNPATTRFYIYGITSEVQVQICNNTGVALISRQRINPSQSVDVSMLPPGVYLIEISVGKAKVFKRFVKL